MLIFILHKHVLVLNLHLIIYKHTSILKETGGLMFWSDLKSLTDQHDQAGYIFKKLFGGKIGKCQELDI